MPTGMPIEDALGATLVVKVDGLDVKLGPITQRDRASFATEIRWVRTLEYAKALTDSGMLPEEVGRERRAFAREFDAIAVASEFSSPRGSELLVAATVRRLNPALTEARITDIAQTINADEALAEAFLCLQATDGGTTADPPVPSTGGASSAT